jgi:hypothetical protein
VIAAANSDRLAHCLAGRVVSIKPGIVRCSANQIAKMQQEIEPLGKQRFRDPVATEIVGFTMKCQTLDRQEPLGVPNDGQAK